MLSKYLVKCTEKHCIEISKPNSSILVYKIPYKVLKNEIPDIYISNRFIVYILVGKDKEGKEIIYVGKSKNGIDNRPTSHEENNQLWKTCYILTVFNEDTFFNDGVIQYIENKIHQRLKILNIYENTTKTTTPDTISQYDAECSEEFLLEAFNMLYTIGLDLFIENNNEKDIKSSDKIPQISQDTNIKNICSNILNSLNN